MAAPTSAVQILQKILANGAPSTHGLKHAYKAAVVCALKHLLTLSLGLESRGGVSLDARVRPLIPNPRYNRHAWNKVS
jgi:hypothetical protein